MPVDLIMHARRIPPPLDYFCGSRWKPSALPDNVLLFVRKTGYDINQDNQNTFHSRNVLLVPLEGSGRVVVNGQVSQLAPGCCLFIEPYQFHHYIGVQTGRLCWLFVTFDGEDKLPGGVTRIPAPEVFASDLRALMGAWLKKPQDARSIALRLAIILEGLRGGTPHEWRLKSSRDESLLLRVHQIVLSHLSAPLDILGISRLVGLSESSLRSQFRRISGYSVGNFQQRIRLLEASKMLREKNMSVSETAAACGWESPYSFSRAFSAYWGMPPKKFALSGGSSGRQRG